MYKLVAILCCLFACNTAYAAKYIHGHTNKNGTYTQGHFRSTPNSKRYDNLNSRTRQTNPYSGKKGYQRDEFSSPSATYQRRHKK